MKANKLTAGLTAILLAGSALAMAACGGKPNTVEYHLESGFNSQDAGGARIPMYLDLETDFTASLSFENWFNGNGAKTEISTGTWTVENDEIATLTLGGNAMGVNTATDSITVYLSLNASGLIIADEDSALIPVVFNYGTPAEESSEAPAAKAHAVLADSYEHVSEVKVYDYSFTAGPVESLDVEVGHFFAVTVACEDGYVVDSVTIGGKAAGLQAEIYYCVQAETATDYAVAITTKVAEAA